VSREHRDSPTRTCVGCGARDGQAALVRLQIVHGRVEPVARPGAGRSAYVHGRRECIARIAAGKLLRRSLRADLDKVARLDLAERLCRADASSGRAPQPADDFSTRT